MPAACHGTSCFLDQFLAAAKRSAVRFLGRFPKRCRVSFSKTSRTFRDPSDKSRRDWSLELVSILFELLPQFENEGQRRDGAMIIFVSQKGAGKKKCQDKCRLPRRTLSFSISLSAAAALTVCLSTLRGAAGRRQQVSQRERTPEDDVNLRRKSWLK